MRAFNAREVVLATTLLPLALGKGWISKTVLLNGMAYHGASALGMSVAPLLRKVDVLCNVSFCVLVNAQTQWQPHTGLLTALAVAAWGGAHAAKTVGRHQVSCLLHATLVQWPLLLCLSMSPYA